MELETQAADDGEFESGYTDAAKPTETPASDVVTPESNATPEPAAVTPPPVDPIVEMRAQLEKFQKGHDTLAGHIGNLTRTTKEINDRLAAASAATKQVDDAPSQAQVQAAAGSTAKWEKLKDEFPEWADATDENIDAKISARISAQQTDADAFDRRMSEKVASETAKVRQEMIASTLEVVMDDWQAEVKSPAFAAWLSAQPDTVKAWAESERVGDAARMLKLYDKAKQATAKPAVTNAKTADARQKRLEAAVAPRGSGGAAASRSELDEFEAGYAG